MFEALSRIVPLTLAAVMTVSVTAFGAEEAPVPMEAVIPVYENVSKTNSQSGNSQKSTAQQEVPNPTFIPVSTLPTPPKEENPQTAVAKEAAEATQNTDDAPGLEEEAATQENQGRKLVARELDAKAQPSLFQEAPKPKPPVVVKEKEFDFDIASYTTKYSGAESLNRNYNMRLASDSINGLILQPGESFSYNNVILSKSNNGKMYKEAGIYVNGEVSTGIGGGICQISSTLYQAALYSGMEITKRQNHSLKVGYMPAGRDATASWGSIDFQFKNPLDIPVKIESVMKNGVLKIRFLAQQDPKIGEIKVNVTQKDGVYTLTRTRADGTVDHTSRSKYKN